VLRLQHPEPTQPNVVMVVAAIGIVVNLVTAMLFLRGRHDDLNIRGAFLHMMPTPRSRPAWSLPVRSCCGRAGSGPTPWRAS
jgi:hypothetical protein